MWPICYSALEDPQYTGSLASLTEALIRLFRGPTRVVADQGLGAGDSWICQRTLVPAHLDV